MLLRPRDCHGENAATPELGMSVSEPLSECVVVPSEPLVDRVQYLAARVSRFTDMVMRGIAALDPHATPTSNCP